MVLELPWSKKWVIWAFEKVFFQLFLSDEVEVRQSVQNYLNQNLVIGSFLENGFEATINSH